MSELNAATTTETPARVTDPEAVLELCNEYIFDPLRVEIDRDGRFSIQGYGDLDVYAAEEEDGERYIDYDVGLVTREFFRRLSQYIAEDEELDVRMAGFKRVQTVAAQQYVVRRNEILHGELGHPTRLPDDQQPSPTPECVDRAAD